MTEWFPEIDLPDDGVKRTCKRCGKVIERARVTAGYRGTGQRIVVGGWYGVKGDPGPYCPGCAQAIVQEKKDDPEPLREAGWICTNCGAKYGSPPYLLHSSWGCEQCAPYLGKSKKEGASEG